MFSRDEEDLFTARMVAKPWNHHDNPDLD